MASFEEHQEQIWHQIIKIIDSEEMFIPWKIKQQISPQEHWIFDNYMKVMLDNKMLIEFKSKGLFNRIAYWMIARKFKNHENKKELLDLYVKGPKWETNKQLNFQQVGGDISAEGNIVH